MHYYVKQLGSIVLEIIPEKPAIPGKVPQPSSRLLPLLSTGKGKLLLVFVGTLLVLLYGHNPCEIKAPSQGGVIPQLLHRGSCGHITHRTSPKPTESCEGYRKWEKVEDKHTALLI